MTGAASTNPLVDLAYAVRTALTGVMTTAFALLLAATSPSRIAVAQELLMVGSSL
jgi:hypothetical protein